MTDEAREVIARWLSEHYPPLAPFAAEWADELLDRLDLAGYRIAYRYIDGQAGPFTMAGVQVVDAGGGEVRLVVDRNTAEYPPAGADGLLVYFVRRGGGG